MKKRVHGILIAVAFAACKQNLAEIPQDRQTIERQLNEQKQASAAPSSSVGTPITTHAEALNLLKCADACHARSAPTLIDKKYASGAFIRLYEKAVLEIPAMKSFKDHLSPGQLQKIQNYLDSMQ